MKSGLVDFETFEQTYNSKNSQLLWKCFPADLETPVSALLKLKERSHYHCLYESVQDGAFRGRYSCIALHPDIVWKAGNGIVEINEAPEEDPHSFRLLAEGNPFDELRKLLDENKMDIPDDLPPMAAGLFGYLSYDMVRYIENLPHENADVIDIPDAMLFRPKVVVIFDSVADVAIIVATARYNEFRPAKEVYDEAEKLIHKTVDALQKRHEEDYFAMEREPLNLNFTSNTTRERYHEMVEEAKEYILAGDIFQVVPSQRFRAKFDLPPFALYRSLRHINPSPYLFYVEMAGIALVGSSPEILVNVEHGKATVRPIAGTRKRGKTKEEDLALEKDLLADEKELAEHLMLIDLGRNDIGRIADVGTVEVTKNMIIERYSHVMHIVSNVEGNLREDKTALDALMAGFPVGTVSGAPKIRAMEIIDELEAEKRTFYAGGVGYFSSGGDMDFCIALRTALVKDNTLYIQAGGGVVADSDPEMEYQESCNKAKALMAAAEHADNFSGE